MFMCTGRYLTYWPEYETIRVGQVTPFPGGCLQHLPGFSCAGVAEWSKAAVLRTAECQSSVGSNPTASAVGT